MRPGRVIRIVADAEGGREAVRQLLQARPGGGRRAAHHGVAGGVARQAGGRSDNNTGRNQSEKVLNCIGMVMHLRVDFAVTTVDEYLSCFKQQNLSTIPCCRPWWRHLDPWPEV